MKHQKK